MILNSENGLRYTNYNGESVDDNSIIVTHTLVGDLNLDRAVTIADFITLAGRFGNAGDWGVGDTNYDGQVTISDFLDLASNFNQVLAAEQINPIPQAAASPSSVGSNHQYVLCRSHSGVRTRCRFVRMSDTTR